MSIKIISRGKGKSAVAAAAYRAGEKIKNDYDGLTHDYTRKGGVVHTEILLPDHAPREYFDRSVLWNAVEQIEKNKNAQLSREIELALPVELTAEQHLILLREYINRHFVSAGMCADVCVHDKGDGNPHAHIMLTMRPIEPNGKWGVKCHKINGQKVNIVDWNNRDKAEEWRRGWAAAVNVALENENFYLRVDHRSYKRQSIEQIPTVHLGVAAFQMEKRGIATERGNRNREIESTNWEIRMLRARINKLKKWLAEETATVMPNLQDVFAVMLSDGEGKTRYRKITDLKTAANVLAFLQGNNIVELSQLQERISDMRGRFNTVGSELKKTERRLDTLAEHIQQAEIYAEHKDTYRRYNDEKPNKREAFYERHCAELTLFEAAGRYLKDVMNGHATLPVKAWKEEAAQLTAEKENLYHEYYHLKDEVRDVEMIKRNVEQVVRRDEPEKKVDRVHGMEL